MVAEYAPRRTLCRNGLHPIELKRRNGAKVQCGPCIDARVQLRWELLPGGRWTEPAHDAERQAAYDLWSAGLDDAIAHLRLTEGFDGRTRVWRTLGDVVGMRTALTLIDANGGPTVDAR